MAAVPRPVQGRPALGRASTALAYLVLAAMALTIALPFLWMSVTALKKLPDVFAFGQVIPPEPQWHNFAVAWGKAPFGRYLFNSTFSAVAILCLQFATIVPAAYGFARLRFPGRDALFYLVLATMMVPVQVTFIPTFVIVSRLG
jgi:ABC-type glycerol-3-phosphate transport system permease component